MNKIERAMKTLMDCADALDDLPSGLRRQAILGGFFVTSERLREEAEWLKARYDAMVEGLKESTTLEPKSPIPEMPSSDRMLSRMLHTPQWVVDAEKAAKEKSEE